MTTITQEQADKIKGIIDNDANLAGKYFEVKGLPELGKFQVDLWEKEHPGVYMGMEATQEWYKKANDKYAELVNNKLLPKNVIGACVVGGLAIAMAKANKDIGLYNLWENNDQSIEYLDDATTEAIETYFGIDNDMLDALQDINDRHHPGATPFLGVTPTRLTKMRRQALKEQVDKFVTGEESDYWSNPDPI